MQSTMEITDPSKEIIGKRKRKRNNYLVLDTLNILSYISLTFPFPPPRKGKLKLLNKMK